MCVYVCKMCAYLSGRADVNIPLRSNCVRLSSLSVLQLMWQHVTVCSSSNLCVCVPVGLIMYQIPFVLGAHCWMKSLSVLLIRRVQVLNCLSSCLPSPALTRLPGPSISVNI